ncbi:hypothetical protein C8F01DRAFT_1259346 [Mycena amicta]|nr:hypothetical protein C8F01DRAFT_1259346 [Mycena amicta]
MSTKLASESPDTPQYSSATLQMQMRAFSSSSSLLLLRVILSTWFLFAQVAAAPGFTLASREAVDSSTSETFAPSASGSKCTCAGTAYNASLVDKYDCGDYRLGPKALVPSSRKSSATVG